MSHEGYADPVTNDVPGFHSNMPVSELAEHDTRAIEASVVSSAPLVAETTNGVTHKPRPTPTKPNGAQGLKTPKLICLGCVGCTDARIHKLYLVRSLN